MQDFVVQKIFGELRRTKKNLSKEGIRIINVTIETSEVFGDLKAQLKKKGKMIPLNGIWIAAHAIETGSKLITKDKHFTDIPGLRVWDELNEIEE